MSRTVHKPQRVPSGPNKRGHKKDERNRARTASKRALAQAMTDPDSYLSTPGKRASIYQRFYW